MNREDLVLLRRARDQMDRRLLRGPQRREGLRHAGISPADRTALGDLLAKGLLGRLNLSTADVDAVFDHVQATGAEVVQEPMDQAYGVRDCAFRDPAGNLIWINQPRR